MGYLIKDISLNEDFIKRLPRDCMGQVREESWDNVRYRTDIMEEINIGFRRYDVDLYMQGNRSKVDDLNMQ